MSPNDKSMPGIKGKRVPGRPGRFDPTEPLHMTTRRAAKIPTVNGTPSVTGTIDDDSSRRGSIDDSRPFTSYSNGSQISAKSRRLSDISVPAFTPEGQMNGIHSSEGKTSDEAKFKPLPPVEQSPSREPTLSPSRKRKRSPSPQPPSTPQQPESTAATSFDNIEIEEASPNYEDEMDIADVVHPDDMSDREVPASQGSSRSDEDAMQLDDAFMAPSIDQTPAVSGQISPATSESKSQDEMASAKQLGAALEIARAELDEQDERDENEDIVEPVDGVDDADEVDEQVRSGDDGRPRRGRFGGRRRAKHAIPRVEQAMQRQSELKSAYRNIARAQKALLAEIAQRTVDELEADATSHSQASEFEEVRAGLEAALAERKRRIRAQHDLSMAQLKMTWESQQHVQKSMFQQEKDVLHDEKLDLLEHDALRITRAAHLRNEDNSYETEDEDDIVPRPKGMGYRWKRTVALDQAYDSRSRLGLQTQRAMFDVDKRSEMRKMLDGLPDEDKPDELKGFTVRDGAAREVAIEQRHSRLNTKTLANAAAEIERLQEAERASRNIIRNEDAIGLQMLGDLASRPSISIPGPPQDHPKRRTGSFVGQTPPRQMPPHLQVQTDQGPSRIPVEMSPRTTQALNDRYDAGRYPPSTPQQGRQEADRMGRSPEAARPGSQMKSPATNGQRSDVFKLLHGMRPGSRPGSQSGPLARSSLWDDDAKRDRNLRDGPGPPSFRFGERTGPPLWKDYTTNQPSVFERRPSTHENTPRFGFLSGGMRPSLGNPNKQEGGEREDEAKNRSSGSFNFLHSRPPPRQEPASQAGAADAKVQRPRSPKDSARRSTLDLGQSPHSRNSASFSANDFRSEQEKQKQQGFKNTFSHKTNKEQRGGNSRRSWSQANKIQKLGKPLDRPGPASAISTDTGPSQFARSPDERAAPPATWQTTQPPLRSPLGPPPPSAFGQAPLFGRPPPPFPPSIRDLFGGRSSFSSSQPGSIWNQPSPSPLYAVPQAQHPPPSSGPPDQYGRSGPPPRFPGYPHPPTPQSAPGSYSQQFGGPPLAPAGNQGFHPPGFRPSNPLPAFAQQAQQQQNQQQQQNGPGHRRRAQSDSNFAKFHNWNPPSGRR